MAMGFVWRTCNAFAPSRSLLSPFPLFSRGLAKEVSSPVDLFFSQKRTLLSSFYTTGSKWAVATSHSPDLQIAVNECVSTLQEKLPETCTVCFAFLSDFPYSGKDKTWKKLPNLIQESPLKPGALVGCRSVATHTTSPLSLDQSGDETEDCDVPLPSLSLIAANLNGVEVWPFYLPKPMLPSMPQSFPWGDFIVHNNEEGNGHVSEKEEEKANLLLFDSGDPSLDLGEVLDKLQFGFPRVPIYGCSPLSTLSPPSFLSRRGREGGEGKEERAVGRLSSLDERKLKTMVYLLSDEDDEEGEEDEEEDINQDEDYPNSLDDEEENDQLCNAPLVEMGRGEGERDGTLVHVHIPEELIHTMKEAYEYAESGGPLPGEDDEDVDLFFQEEGEDMEEEEDIFEEGARRDPSSKDEFDIEENTDDDEDISSPLPLPLKTGGSEKEKDKKGERGGVFCNSSSYSTGAVGLLLRGPLSFQQHYSPLGSPLGSPFSITDCCSAYVIKQINSLPADAELRKILSDTSLLSSSSSSSPHVFAGLCPSSPPSSPIFSHPQKGSEWIYCTVSIADGDGIILGTDIPLSEGMSVQFFVVEKTQREHTLRLLSQIRNSLLFNNQDHLSRFCLSFCGVPIGEEREETTSGLCENSSSVLCLPSASLATNIEITSKKNSPPSSLSSSSSLRSDTAYVSSLNQFLSYFLLVSDVETSSSPPPPSSSTSSSP